MTRVKNSPRILYVTSELPFPPNVGVRQRIFHIGRLLQNCGHVSFALVSRFAVEGPSLDNSKKHFGEIELFRADLAAGSGTHGKAARLMNRRDVRCRHGGFSIEERERFLDLVQNFDVVWFHGLKTADMTGIYRIVNSVLDVDDLHSEKYKLEALVTRGLTAKVRLWWLYILWHRWEKDAPKRFRAICVCSQSDKARFDYTRNIYVIPNGFQPSLEKKQQPALDDLRFGFIGTLKYHPNLDGVNWFINEVLPQILKRFPRVKARIVGELTPEKKFCEHPNVDWLGFVNDLETEMSTWTASIVPLRIGGGTRIKILEALSRRCPVVSTTTGAYGLDLEHGRHLLIGDTAQDFAQCCVRLIKNQKFSQELARAGWQRFAQRYTWDAIQPAVESVVTEVLKRDEA